MRSSWRSVIFAIVVVAVTSLALVNAAATGSSSTVRNKMTLIAPAAPGGGWDGFAREAQQALRTEGIINNVQVVNVPGAGGTIGLSQFVRMDGRTDVLMVTGGVMVGAIAIGDTPETLADVTPVARMADDYAALVVPADSDIETLDQFVEQWRADPTGVSIAGGSLGSIDHLATGMLARELGLDPSSVNYIAYSGGGEALSAMLSRTTTGGMSGYNEVAGQIDAGQLRLLAVSSDERIPGAEAPTFLEEGIDVSMSNWRGLVAPQGLSDEHVAELHAIVDELHGTPTWRDALEKNSWSDSYLVGEEFEGFITEETTEITALVRELGL